MTGISVDDMLADFFDHVGIDTSIQSDWTDNSNAKALRYINRAWWGDILNQYPFKEAEASVSFNTSLGTISYPVPTSSDAVTAVSFNDPITLQQVKLRKISPSDYQELYSGQTYGQGIPDSYYIYNNQIILFPTPDNQVYPITVNYLATLQDLATDGTVVIPREWHELILLGAVHRALLSVRDYQGAAFIKNMQTSLTNDKVSVNTKENVDNKYSGLVYGRNSMTENGEYRNGYGGRSGYYGRGLWR